MKAQYAIMRFAKYKGPEIGRIEAHDERTKEQYASNPDVDTARSKYNYHLVEPTRSYRAEVERQIAAAGCRTRKDSVRVVEVLFTASPEFFKGKKPAERRAFFEESLNFIKSKQNPETIISAVVHMDEKTPHMHLSFVPLTKDGRLSAKDIVGNRARLQKWQDEYWKYMVKKWPDLERGESATETGRTHIPPRLFKEAAHLQHQQERLTQLLSEVTPLNAKKKTAEIEALIDQYIPGVEKLRTQLNKFSSAYRELKAENARLEKQLDASKEGIVERLRTAEKLRELDELRRVVDSIPPEILRWSTTANKHKGRGQSAERGL
ncbi:MAG: plasmid recombination protein [Acidaminococcaceae bacterium]|nr:plasmid recombination protein [Acidaminococcaceae bacterium]